MIKSNQCQALNFITYFLNCMLFNMICKAWEIMLLLGRFDWVVSVYDNLGNPVQLCEAANYVTKDE